MPSTTQQKVFEIIAEQARIELATITPESTLTDLGVTSLEAIEIIFEIEEHFEINFPEQKGPSFDTDTAQSLVEAVESALAERNREPAKAQP